MNEVRERVEAVLQQDRRPVNTAVAGEGFDVGGQARHVRADAE